MPRDTREKAEIKVTDKRIFTADGNIREEFRGEISPSEPAAAKTATPAPPEAATPSPSTGDGDRKAQQGGPRQETGESRRTMAEKGESPTTPFGTFIQSLAMQAYMTLGMLRNPYQPQAKPDPVAARELIDIISMLEQKTAGNLTREEEDLLTTHLGQLKLAYVQKTKSLS